jgi:hypothetical protein
MAEPYARKKVAKANSLPSGTIPVLASIAFELFSTQTHTSEHVYGVKMAADSLVRRYIGLLVKAGLVTRHRHPRKRTTLQISVEGQMVMNQYQRELREGCLNLGVRATRVVTA